MTTQSGSNDLNLRQFFEPEELAADANLDGVSVNSAFVDQAALFALYATRAAGAARQASMVKLQRDAVIAEVSQRERDLALANKEKLTETALGERVTLDERVKKVRRLYIEATKIEEEARVAAEAIRHKRDMLIQLGANLREELKGSMTLSSQTASSQRGDRLKNALSRST